ncbi:hypothetical protein SEUCBS140593_009856 [Sporothrix eucalyptigena]|uniref:FAD-binding PCMH-type domain-containing protein n=1 Tax=Sporothrix eucalyptigena TaxID=1812306 RepID=A0ABP0CZE9_9PEZI
MKLTDCSALETSGLGDRLLYAHDDNFQKQTGSYFSAKARYAAQCIFQPRTAAEVALAVKTLVAANQTKPCPFAIRGNGHTTNPDYANIRDGVTMDLAKMNSTTYHASNQTASVLPGATWGMVYAALDPLHVMVAGGRSFSVGVSGLVIGGGNSFFSPQVGMVCDGVAQFEVVLASGAIVYASRDQNADLFQALKGGTSNFGVVTRLDLYAFPNTDLWGGLVSYPNSTAAQQFSSLAAWPARLQTDPRATVIVFCSYASLTDTTVFVNSYEYTQPVARPPIFDNFLALPGNTSDTTRVTNMTSLVFELEQPEHYRIRYYTLTFVNDERILAKTNDLFNDMVQDIKAEVDGDYKLQYLFQPLPRLYTDKGLEKGGNILGLDRTEDDLVLALLYISWVGEEHDELFESRAIQMKDDLHAYAASVGGDNEYIYLDYADETQDPLGSYGAANVAKMRAVARKYDPTGVFQHMVPGGFKISKVTKYAGDEVHGDGMKHAKDEL